MKSLQKVFWLVYITMVSFISCTEKAEVVNVPTQGPIIDKNWQFESTPSWEDDFATSGAPDLAKWNFEVGGSGWGNNELQYYTPGQNATVAGGNLIIIAKKESNSGREYTSTRMITKGKGDWLYGRIDVRAKLPKGRGTWPAIWLFPTESTYGIWPASGEIDIMEHVGYDQNKVHFTIHNSAFNFMKGNQKSAFRIIPTSADEFHNYRVDWTPYSIKGFIDGEQYFEYVNANNGFTSWPYDKKFHLILNIAVGGDWGGVQGVDNTIFPATMTIDYVRYYKLLL